jgi:hypothetical protein
VRAKALASRGRGPSLALAQGALYDWLRQPVPVYGELGLELVVVPDERADWAAARRKRLRAAYDSLDRGMWVDVRALRSDVEPPEESGPMQAVAAVLAERLRTDHAELRARLSALDGAYAEIGAQLGGESVATPVQLEALERARADLDELTPALERLVGPLPEPHRDEAFADQLRRAVAFEQER